VERLEDRLTPAAAPPFVPTPFSLPLLSALERNLPALVRGLEAGFQHGTMDDLRLRINEFKTRKALDPAHSILDQPPERIHLGNHPILAALAASGGGLLRLELNDPLAPPPAVPLAPGFVATTMILVHSESSNPSSGVSASSLALSSPGDFAGLPTRLPLLAESLGFSPFNSLSLMTPSKDRSIVFELSPYSPAGPDIVPIPVPRGMDDWFAELFGNPSQGPGPDASLGGAPGASNDSDAAVRDAVLQMLHADVSSPPLSAIGSPRLVNPPEPTVESRAPGAETNAFEPIAESCGPIAEPDAEAAKPAYEFTAGSLLGLFFLGMVRNSKSETRNPKEIRMR
jgi:hypothetical protein